MQMNRELLLYALIGAFVMPASNPTRAADSSGKALFAQCSVCHSGDGSNGVGPSLQGITARKAGSFAGFRYSRAMKSATFSWDEANLDRFLADPQAVVPGNVMPFAGLTDAKLRKALIAYLATLK